MKQWNLKVNRAMFFLLFFFRENELNWSSEKVQRS